MSQVPPLVEIIGVEVLGNQALRLTFKDGTVGDVHFDDREWRGVLEPLRDPEFFACVRVDRQSGTITWPGDLDLAPEPLYEEACRHPVAPARTGL